MPAPTRRDGNAVYYNQTDPPSHHFIEQAVTVYLRLSDDGTRWIVDGPSVDGYPLNSAHEDLRATNCECACERTADCREVLEAADKLPLPTAAELVGLITRSARPTAAELTIPHRGPVTFPRGWPGPLFCFRNPGAPGGAMATGGGPDP